jgi:hypothetical protein
MCIFLSLFREIFSGTKLYEEKNDNRHVFTDLSNDASCIRLEPMWHIGNEGELQPLLQRACMISSQKISSQNLPDHSRPLLHIHCPLTLSSQHRNKLLPSPSPPRFHSPFLCGSVNACFHIVHVFLSFLQSSWGGGDIWGGVR